MENEKRLPEKKFRVGAVSAAVWRSSHTGKDGKVFDVSQASLDRTWVDKDGSFHSSNSYGINELPRLILAAQKAYEYLAASSEPLENRGEREE